MTGIAEAPEDGHQGYLNADGSPRPFPWWYGLMIIGIITVFFPLLLTPWLDYSFFRRAHIQRWSVILNLALLQGIRVVFGLTVWKLAWTWLAWTVCLLLIWRIWSTANVWWALIEDPATWSAMKGRAT